MNFDWQGRAAALADRLSKQGIITDAGWREVVASVPRHTFVPEFYDDDSGAFVRAGDARWSELVYSDETLVTQRMEHPDQPGFQWSTSSSTRPGLMLRMLHILDVRRGMNVLEVGTGTGYNAALLSARVGSEHVTTVDIDPLLTSAARERLKEAGYAPGVITRDGRRGCAERGPYDRVIATVATEQVPYAWVEQTRPGGVILADIRPRGMTWAGALARLTVAEGGTAGGPLVPCTWGFMSARPDVARPGIPESVAIDATTVHHRQSKVDGAALHRPGLSLVVWQRLPGVNVFPGDAEIEITVPDGSWAKASTTVPGKVEYGGPSDIWAEVEGAHDWWTSHGQPGVEAFGLAVDSAGQSLHLLRALDGRSG